MLFLHILAGSLLLLLAVVRFLIVVVAHRSPATLGMTVIGVGVLQLVSGLVLVFVEQASLMHMCLSAVASLAFMGIAEVWLQTAHQRRYSESSK